MAYPGWHAIGFRHPSAGYVAGLFPQEDSVRFLFEWGVLLQDPDRLLTDGGKQTRYAEYTRPEQIPTEGLAALLLETVSVRRMRASSRA